MDSTIAELRDDALATDPEAVFLGETAKGEKLVWTGGPRVRARQIRPLVTNAIICLLWIGLGVLWVVTVVISGGRWDDGRKVPPFAAHNVVIATGVGVIIMGGARFMTRGFARAVVRLRGSRYALTDRRILIWEPDPFGVGRILSYGPPDFRLPTLREFADGSGDLILDSRRHWAGWSGIEEPVGLLAIDRVREVDALVRKTLHP